MTIGISAGVAVIMGAYFYLFPRVRIRRFFLYRLEVSRLGNCCILGFDAICRHRESFK